MAKKSHAVPPTAVGQESPTSPVSTGSDALMPALSTLPRTTGGPIEGEDVPEEERPKQPTLEDLGRALRERRQVHAWIDLEMQDSAVGGLAEAFENLKDRVNSWAQMKALTDYKLTTEYEIKQPAFRREMMKRIKPLATMLSPLSSDRPVNAAPQIGAEPRLLGGIADVLVKNFPPVGKRGAVSAEIVASYPFRLCGDEWSIDLACNRHWVKLLLCYRGSKPSVDRITSAWFRSDGADAALQYIFEPKQVSEAHACGDLIPLRCLQVPAWQRSAADPPHR